MRTESRQRLIEYVNIRAQFSNINPNAITDETLKLIVDSEVLQDELWSLVNKASSQEKNTESFALYVESLNEVIDLHSKRYNQGIQYRLPRSLWFVLYFVTMLAMCAVGYEFAMAESESFLGSLFLALMFSAIVLIISDLDQPRPRTLIGISQRPMLDLQQKLNSSGK